MALLDIDRLILRFGGLVAVNEFSLQVREREIVSIIGPNGAGKTTVFNAITGIYPPTSGVIRFQGEVVARPVTWRLWAACVAVAFCTSLGLGLAALNVDLLWRATIRRAFHIDQFYRQAANAHDPLARRFTFAEAIEYGWGYLRGDLAMEPTARGWRVVSNDGRTTLARAPRESEARARRDALNRLLHSSLRPEIEVDADGAAFRWSPGDEGRFHVAGASRDDLEATLAALDDLRAANRSRRLLFLGGLLFGGVLGFAGYYVVWNRSRRSPDVIARGGVSRTFQNIRLFHNMTVLENVLVGLDRTVSPGVVGWLRTLVRPPGRDDAERLHLRRARELLSFMGLDDRRDTLARQLPYGDQRRLEIARAMATGPRLLLLDEPAAGMNPAESEELMGLIRRIREKGITILLIEHHMKLVMGISDRVAVLEYGRGIAEGAPEEVRRNPRVIEAYLGKEEVG